MPKPTISCLLLACTALLLCKTLQAAGQDDSQHDADDKTEFKFTASSYQSSVDNDATDFNLRLSHGEHTGWIGRYADDRGFTQERLGYDNKQDFGLVRLVSTLEFGSRGYAGVAALTELGGETFAIAGLSRTNLRPFYNLGFDPGDAVTIGAGTRAWAGTELSLFQVRDNRLDTRQQATHLLWRYKPAQSQRLTVDAVRKSGIDDDGARVRGYALTVTYDYGSYFARIGRDQYANFSASHLTRFSVGMRF